MSSDSGTKNVMKNILDKLFSEYEHDHIHITKLPSGRYNVQIFPSHVHGTADSPEEALCKAFEELIEEDKKMPKD